MPWLLQRVDRIPPCYYAENAAAAYTWIKSSARQFESREEAETFLEANPPHFFSRWEPKSVVEVSS
jgi:hypothetical protein